MSNLLKKLVGIVYVQQKGDVIQIGGMAAQNLARDIQTTWGTSKINLNMFTDLGRRSIEFKLFYALEVHFMLQTLLKNRRNWTSRNTLLQTIKLLEENTWLANLAEGKEHDKILDRSKLALFHKTPLEHQTNFFDKYEYGRAALGLKGYLLSAAAGTGKAQPLYSKIKTPSGWTTMGQIKVGDVITAWDGSPTNVVGVFPQGEKEVYEITLKDGRTVHACGEHLWRAYNNREIKSKPDHCRVIQTTDIQQRLASGKRVHLDLLTPEQGVEQELPLDPYLLGVIIGDGSTANRAVLISQADEELFGYVAQALPEGVQLVFKDQPDRVRTCGVSRIDPSKPNPVTAALAAMDLRRKRGHEKFIPAIYFNASLGQRISLFQGLMDTDGTACSNGGSISYCTVSEQLALDVQRLVWSLGGIASISAKQTHYTYLGERRAGRIAFQINIRMKKPSQAFRLTRKRALVRDDNQYSENLKLEVVSVERIGTEPCQCISIDHPDHLYITDDYVVTHNTLTDLMIAEMVHSDYVVIVSPNNAVYRVWDKALKEEYRKPQEAWIPSEGKPYKGQRFLIGHYEALAALLAQAKQLSGKITIVLDECHNFNEIKSQRTQLFIQLCESTKSENVIWASGTPIKALGGESIPLLKTIDPLFDSTMEVSFTKVFGISARRALDILRNRMGFISYRVEKKEVVDNREGPDQELRVKIPNGSDYTLDTIRAKMAAFIVERLEYYKKNYKSYEDIYLNGLAVFERTLQTSEGRNGFKEYKRQVDVVKKNPDARFSGEEMKFCNKYEKEQIMPALSNEERKRFKSAKSVIKYVQLKVMGEALGGVLGKARTQLHIDMLAHIDFRKIMHQAEKKTVIFTSYVEVVKQLDKQLKALGLKPMLVFGETNKNLTSNVGAFENDDEVDPLVATYPSLSTAVPLIMADLTIFLNVPFRDHELVQARARTDRLGQDTKVKYVMVFLDTGKEPNISTRSKEILDWSRQQVAQILGADYNGNSREVMEGYIASLESFEVSPIVTEFESTLSEIMDVEFGPESNWQI